MAAKKSLVSKRLPATIDVCSGAGGLSLGAARAGFSVAGAIEIDHRAMATHRMNFAGTAHFETSATRLSGSDILAGAGLKKGELIGLVGGTPCQGFSRIGARKAYDPRSLVFRHFMRLVCETKPAFFLAENVPGILDKRHSRRVASALDLVPRKYRILEPFTLRASDYGAPTNRERVIFFGYDPSRLKDVDADDFKAAQVGEAVTVREALHGLPLDILPEWIDEADSWRPVHVTKSGHFFDRIVGAVPEGLGEPTAMKRFFDEDRVHGNFGTRHSETIIRRYGALEYGEADPITKSIRLNPSGLCPTLRAGTGPDAGSFQAVRPIHYLRPRVITPREAARLQGFPDWFRFDRTKWHSFRQIGNSVSPLLAEAIMRVVAKAVKT